MRMTKLFKHAEIPFSAQADLYPPVRWRAARLALVAALSACGLLSAPLVAADTAGSASPSSAEVFAEGGTQTLIPAQLVHWAVMRNAETRGADLRRESASRLVDAERAIYDPLVTARLRQDYSDLPQSPDDNAIIFLGGAQDRSTERRTVAETGVSVKVPTGGEIQLLYRMQKRRVMTGSDTDEYRGAVNITFQQPLLRGLGRALTEAELRVAEVDHQIEALRYEDQVLKVAAEAVNAYWQLYRAQQGLEMRRAALGNAQAALVDVEDRVKAGWAPATDLTEAKIAVASREADVARAARLLDETRGALMTLLNIRPSVSAAPEFVPAVPPNPDAANKAMEERLELALASLPSLRMAASRIEQERIRTEVAMDQKRPDLRLELGYNRNSLDGRAGRAFDDSFKASYDGWYAGLVFERPLGNHRASSAWEAQLLRLKQSQSDAEGLMTSVHNDVMTRWHQMESARREVELHKVDVELRQQLLHAEREQYDVGRVRLGRVFEREDELMQTRQNLLDSLTRFELARVALDFADGSLLDGYGVVFDKGGERGDVSVDQASFLEARQSD